METILLSYHFDRKNFYEIAIYVLFLLILIVDSINGIMIKNGFHSIAQPYKLLILFVMLLRILSRPKFNSLFFIGAISTFFSIALIVHVKTYINEGVPFSYGDEIAQSFRFIFLITTFFYFYQFPFKGQSKYRNIILINWLVLVANVFLGILGIGFKQYEGKVGGTGFIYSGNEMTALLILFVGLVVIPDIISKSWKSYILKSIVILSTSLCKATKTGIIATILLLIMLPIIYERRSFFILTKLRIAMIFGGVILFAAGYIGIQQMGILDRFMWFLNQKGLLSAIFSDRNAFIISDFQDFFDNFSINTLIFGLRYETMEMDWADIFFTYGLLGFFLLYGFIWYVCTTLWKGSHLVKSPYAKGMLFTIIIVMLTGLFAGHTYMSGMLAAFFGFSVTWALQSKYYIHKSTEMMINDNC